MEYLFSKCTFHEDGTATIPSWAVERWQRQMLTPYEELSEKEQDSDRKEADKFLALLPVTSKLHKGAKGKLPGGLGEKLSPKDVDPKQLAKGIRVEKEHGGDKALHEEIALDHLAENPRYYDYLEEMEKGMEKKARALRAGVIRLAYREERLRDHLLKALFSSQG